MKLHFIGGPEHEKVRDSSEFDWDGWSPINFRELRRFNVADLFSEVRVEEPIYTYRRVDLTSGVILMIEHGYTDEFAAELYRRGPVPAPDPAGFRAWNRALGARFKAGERVLPPRAEEFDYERPAHEQARRWPRLGES